LAVWGRSVTFVLQNLRSAVREEVFDEWYAPYQQEMREDDLMRYFKELRNEVEKQGTLGGVGVAVDITSLSSADLQTLTQHRPPGARGFFIGDQHGGSGWEVELPDGTIENYYVTLTDELNARIQARFFAQDPSTEHRGEQLTDTSVEALADHYVTYLGRLVDAAKQRFGS
jgi:hypothetical protein